VISQGLTVTLPFTVSRRQPAKAQPSNRHALMLRTWEAINLERELPNLLAAV
jgi:hypothetical protein